MQLHERYFKVAGAGAEIGMAISKIASENELTCAEVVQILADEILKFNQYVIRYERHGDMDKKGDEA